MDEFAEKLLEYLNGAEAFLKTQTPDFVNQFVAYEMWKVSWEFHIWLVVLVVLAILQVIWIVKCVLNGQDGDGLAIVAIGFAGSVALTCTIRTYMSLKQMEIAPKVYMVEAAKRLIVEKK